MKASSLKVELPPAATTPLFRVLYHDGRIWLAPREADLLSEAGVEHFRDLFERSGYRALVIRLTPAVTYDSAGPASRPPSKT